MAQQSAVCLSSTFVLFVLVLLLLFLRFSSCSSFPFQTVAHLRIDRRIFLQRRSRGEISQSETAHGNSCVLLPLFQMLQTASAYVRRSRLLCQRWHASNLPESERFFAVREGAGFCDGMDGRRQRCARTFSVRCTGIEEQPFRWFFCGGSGEIIRSCSFPGGERRSTSSCTTNYRR